MNIQPIKLTGTRVNLIPYEESHAPALFQALQEPAVWAYSAPIKCENDMRSYMASTLEESAKGLALPFSIWDLRLNKFVGTTRLADISAAHRQLEIGWTALSPEIWRTRVNTECKYMLLRHCFEELGLIRVQLKADSRNTRSLNAMERIGAVREGVLRRHRVLTDGYVRDTVYYSFIDTEWPESKAHLERLLAKNYNEGQSALPGLSR